jgi:DNA-binding GntR family transcriptional regulator
MRRPKEDPRHRQSGPGAPTSKADHAYETILQSILDGEYEPGERLVIERLARELGVSVVPVREAIRRLEADGYVTFTRNIGATVTAIDLDRYPETIEAVAAIEGIAIGLAAPHLTTTDLRRAHEVNDRLRDSLTKFDPTQFTRLNRRFHEILYGACPNRHILAILEREWALLDTTRRSAFTYIPERAARSVQEHDDLLEMIERGATAADIERFARDHRMSTARRLLQHLGDKMEHADGSSDALGGAR